MLNIFVIYENCHELNSMEECAGLMDLIGRWSLLSHRILHWQPTKWLPTFWAAYFRLRAQHRQSKEGLYIKEIIKKLIVLTVMARFRFDTHYANNFHAKITSDFTFYGCDIVGGKTHTGLIADSEYWNGFWTVPRRRFDFSFLGVDYVTFCQYSIWTLK
jgi:hypothetical protein